MDWFARQGGEGVEYHLLMIAAALALIFDGAGLLSVDARWRGDHPIT
jgi:uncharacterized membrane protein YphA (DoxX/SURF4 family)